MPINAHDGRAGCRLAVSRGLRPPSCQPHGAFHGWVAAVSLCEVLPLVVWPREGHVHWVRGPSWDWYLSLSPWGAACCLPGGNESQGPRLALALPAQGGTWAFDPTLLAVPR